MRIYLKKRGEPIDPTSDFYRKAGLAALRDNVRGYEMLLDRQAGKIVDTPTPILDKGPKLHEAFVSWKAGGNTKGAKKPGPSAMSDSNAKQVVTPLCGVEKADLGTRHEIERRGEVPTVDGNAVTALRPHDAAATRNRERPIETRDNQRREIAGDALDGEMEAATIGLSSRSLAEGVLVLLKGSDERRDDGLKLRRSGAALRIEPCLSG